MRALERRPTTLERWPKGVHPGIVVSTREKGGSARRTRDTEDRRRVLVEVAPEVRERAVELYGRPEEGARALARYTDEQLQFLIESLRGSVGYQEERLRRLEALKASDAADSQARP
jgi:DNA-binding MarR family transcriptional regulator